MTLTTEQIHYTMSRVRSSGSAIEKQLGSALWRAGLRYRKQYRIFGKPDFVLVSQKIAIFVDSDFWHGYRWGSNAKKAFKSNQEYWYSKIERNRTRDKIVNRKLSKEGWIVMRFWEHEISSNLELCVRRVILAVHESNVTQSK